MNKILWILLAGLAVVLIVVALAVGFYLGPIAKIGMEQIGPKVMQVSIKADSLNISLLSGSATINNLVVGNPQGYSTAQSISVGTVAASLDPSSVLSNKILIRSVKVESPEITFEGSLTGNNLSKILDNVNSFTKKYIPDNGKPAPKIEVDDFLITGAKVHVNLSGLVSRDITLPDIHLTDLGKDSNGISPAELTGLIINAITTDTVKNVASSVGQFSKSININKITSSLGGLLGR